MSQPSLFVLITSAACTSLAAAGAAHGPLESPDPQRPPLHNSYSTGVFEIELDNVAHVDLRGDADNVVMDIDAFAITGGGWSSKPMHFAGLGWDLEISTIGTSWLSQARMAFSNPLDPGQPEIVLTAGVNNDSPGTGSFSSGGILDFGYYGLEDVVLRQGILRIEFFDLFDDFPDGIDAITDGTLTLQLEYFVPTPGTLALLAFAPLTAGRRRPASA